MDREVVLVVLVAVIVGPLFAAVAPIKWRSIWSPLIPAAFAVALLVGWALAEPPNAEPVPLWAFIVGLPVFLVWGRAMFRAVCALRYPTHSVAADTVGLVWPRVRIAAWFHDALDEPARYAAIAHEDAHARHRDPLRLWLAQFVTDLQWPAPVATTRLARWRHELELSRDDEARRHGVEGADLAAAVVVAAKRPYLPRNTVAILGTADFKLRERIERLLAPLPMQPVVTCWWRFMPLGIALLGALIVGICSGEHAIRLLIGGSR